MICPEVGKHPAKIDFPIAAMDRSSRGVRVGVLQIAVVKARHTTSSAEWTQPE
jgi:hypothetical protein